MILAQNGDETAERFAAAARAAGVACARLAARREADASTWVERDRTPRVSIRFGDREVNAVLNRGLPFERSTSDDASFRSSEFHAAWWTALALAPFPVIHRPDHTGFIPNLSPAALVAAAPGLARRGIIAGPPPSYPDLPAVNVHRVRDAHYAGRFAGESIFTGKDALDPEALYLYTPFDPQRTVRLLLAGSRVFDLASPHGALDPELERQVEPLIAELMRRQANFAAVVMERTKDALYLLQITSLPHTAQFRHVGPQVHQALLEYLKCR